MTTQTQHQLLSDLEKRKKQCEEVVNDKEATHQLLYHYTGKASAFLDCIELIKSITTNRSSQEPKIKE